MNSDKDKNTEIHLEDNPWKRNMKNITEDTIKLIEVVKINNKTKHLSINIVVGI